LIEIRTPVTPDLQTLRSDLGGLGLGSISIQEFGRDDDLLIRLPQQDEGEIQAAINTVKTALDSRFEGQGEVEYRRTEFVGPQVGAELKKQGALAVLFSLLGIMG